METIQMYLNNMFQHLPQIPKVLRAKEELYNMMEDKYHELKEEGKTENEAIGIVISEFGNLEELAEELEIEQYTEKRISLEKSSSANAASSSSVRTIDLEESKSYINVIVTNSFKIAIGVALCICSPAASILASIADNGKADMIPFFGILLSLIMVCTAVALFITSGMSLERYDFMKAEIFQLDSAAKQYVQNAKEQYTPVFASLIAIGVTLCVLSIAPLIGLNIFFDYQSGNNMGTMIGTPIMLIMIAIGTFCFITSGMKKDAYSILLQEKDYTPEIKKRKSVTNKISSIYWTFITALYLAWGFITSDWGRSWIIWPIAGVLYAGIYSICNAVITDKNNH